jgi:cyclic beta-1,2-glucan synthetase
MLLNEVFSGQRLEDYAVSLARAQSISRTPMRGTSLKPRVRENHRILEECFLKIENEIDEKRAIPPAAEWIVDNFHLVRGQLKEIHDSLPAGYYFDLPKLVDGNFKGYPRIYELISEFVAHTDGRLDPDLLFRYLKSYQSETPLAMSELWALSTTLSLVYVENLRLVAERLVVSQEAKAHADRIADEVLGLGEKVPRSLDTIIKELDKEEHPLSFVVYLLQRLRFQEASIDALVIWVESFLARKNLVVDELIAQEHALQTAANSTARNVITSFRFISAFNWPDFFERISLVELTLRQNPMFANMDFATRDRYRHRLEHMAKYSDHSELDIAKKIIQVTGNNLDLDDIFHDPGYHLIGRGRQHFEKIIRYRGPFLERLALRYKGSAALFYPVGNIAVATIVTSYLVRALDPAAQAFWPLLAFLIYFVVSEIQVTFDNRLTVAFLGPQHLPRYNLESGIPEDCATFIVVPTMISRLEGIEAQVVELEIHYLTNHDGHLHFALLTDFTDCFSEHSSEDQSLLTEAAERIRNLNERHGPAPDGLPRFYLFHRKRLFNASENRWMGWERKRGKLHEFNLLLLDKGKTSFLLDETGRKQIPRNIRYVITLDADTKLPRGTVAQLVGTISHPLNKARYDEKKGRVVEGYGILQPRITPALPTTQEISWFQKLTSGPCGIDPYASAVSDVYQDLFNEGSFAGKGIYDLQMFEKSLQGKVPENSLLSHDLFEGNFARCGFLNDVEFFEDFPSHVLVAANRSHRWMRGDWQLLPWLLGRSGGATSLLGRWKIADNLRRSLFTISLFLLFVVSVMAPLNSTGILLTLAFLGLICHETVEIFSGVFSLRPMRLADRTGIFVEDFLLAVQKWSLQFVLLPFNAYLAGDAIVRTFYRVYFSRKKLLEWVPAAQAKIAAVLEFKSFVISMRGAFALTFLSVLVVAFAGSTVPVFAFLMGLTWVMSPLVAYLASLPPKYRLKRPLQIEESELLRQTARKIWHFFATYVTAEESFLPPDNFQEDPEPVVAHRSSPTNFGLYLLSALAARDFGWIGLRELVDRWQKTLISMEALTKFEGHFLNWYETTSGRPLEPRYVSSVDNGNLAGHLIVVAQACQDTLLANIEFESVRAGLVDTLNALKHAFPVKEQALEIPLRRKLLDIQHFLSKNPSRKLDFWLDLQKLSVPFYEEIHRQYYATKDSRCRKLYLWIKELHEAILAAAIEYKDIHGWRDYNDLSLPHDLGSTALLRWKYILSRLSEDVTLQNLPDFCETLKSEIRDFEDYFQVSPMSVNAKMIQQLFDQLEHSRVHSLVLIGKLKNTSDVCQRLFLQMDFGLLYDSSRKLFSIGLRVAENTLDPSYYDLMASEARLLSFAAIAKGDVPAAHWFRLGRALTRVGRGSSLISWSGSMFEYLMPSLVLRTPEGSMIKQTCELSVKKQIEYGQQKSIPWGLSESAYNKRDLHQTYQYSNFGVPALALKRGIENDLVVAPYATFLAAMYEPVTAVQNLMELQKIGAEGEFGFYEAVDFTPSRLRKDQSSAVVKCFMAHHQGMSLVSLANVFFDGIMVRRFHSEPLVQATELLLQERTPRSSGSLSDYSKKEKVLIVQEQVEHISRQYHRVHRATPPTQLLSNGDYTVMLSISGSGFSRYKDQAVTRWREDVTQDHWGQYFFIKDVGSKKLWSATYQPLCAEPTQYEVFLAEDRVRFTREEDKILSELEVFVAPETPAEMRRLVLTNLDEEEREIEVTSYMEAVINSVGADQAHPAFSNLFIQTEFVDELQTLFASRRARSNSEKPLWMAHGLATDFYTENKIEYETDRFVFLGRGRSIRRAAAFVDDKKLTQSLGSVLDPIMSLRTRVKIPAGTKVSLTFFTAVANSREELKIISENLHDSASYDRISSLAWTQAQIKLHYLNIEPDEGHLFQRLATRLMFLDSSLRPSAAVLKANSRDLTGLWAQGISGDNPIMLVRVEDQEETGIVRQLLKAQSFLAAKNFKVDLVIVNTQGASYSQELQKTLESLGHGAFSSPMRGGVFTLQANLLSHEERVQLYSEARVIFSGRMGSLSEQLNRTLYTPPAELLNVPVQTRGISSPLPPLELAFFNGLGGFADDGKEYVIHLDKTDTMTPAPWINVISNKDFGFQVSEVGAGYTWSKNSRENQLTSWSNDPVVDPSGEAFYIYDHELNSVWSPTASPIRVKDAPYRARHGQGYSLFEHDSHGFYSQLTQFVMKDKPVKISRLVLENKKNDERKVSIYGYVEWVLGFVRATMAPTTVTEWDEESQMIFATNVRNAEFGKRVAFAGFLVSKQSFTCDRREFIGRNRNLANPLGVVGAAPLSRAVGAGFDPCAAFQMETLIPRKGTYEISFVLGQADSRKEAQEIIRSLQKQSVQELLTEVQDDWEDFLTQVQVETPEPSFDVMMNRWLMYQTLVCRFWSRSAFYQAGGAYGFRDQLQDVLSLMLTAPDIARTHILRAASRQFIEGDVQHWWHPPSGRGVRTHFSDDLLWLPYVVSHYLKTTHDDSVLEERVTFLEGPLLRADQEDSYFTPKASVEAATLFEHCARALDKSLKVGAHGLPLMGCGDWNDGMNRIGQEGKGESVWLAWFLIPNLENFAELAIRRGERERAEKWRAHIQFLKGSLENQAWDGKWYRRAFYDDGSPVGSTESEECNIDSLAQTWAVISGAADKDRARLGMKSFDEMLVKEKDQLVLLFTPPFDKTTHDPGYIKGYLPGVRENGGQYTHAATWSIIAHVLLGNGDRALEIFNMINPVEHGKDPAGAQKYKVEPYVLAGDVYSQAPHSGRGGWSWYTGAAGWMHRAGLEYMLGLQIQGNELTLNPCISSDWKEFKIRYKFGGSLYQIQVRNPQGVQKGIRGVAINGKAAKFPLVLIDDGKTHHVDVTMGTEITKTEPLLEK